VHQGDYCADLFLVQNGRVHAFMNYSRTSYKLTFVGEFSEGYDFNMANALRVKDKCWATYRASETTDVLWIDITRLDLDSDIMKDFEMHAMQEMKLHEEIETHFSRIKEIDVENKLYATPAVIYKREVVLLEDIEGEVVHYKHLKNHEHLHDEVKQYKVFRPIKGDPKNHEIVMETTSDMLKRFVINPNSKFKSRFDGYIALCTVLVIVILPLRMGFSIKANGAWTIYDIIIELSFIADIIVSFFTAYEMSDSVLNTDKNHISARYLKSWFVLDVISGLPVSMLTLNEGFLLLKFFKFARIMRLIRVMRVFKITRLLKIMKVTSLYEEKPFSTSEETSVKFLRLSFIVLVFTHITACFWSKLANDKTGTDTWEDSIGVENSSLWTRYLASFYLIYVTMNTTGYGDILAQNDVESFFILFVIVFGSFLVAHVVAEISETNTGRECSTERVYLLRSYLANKKIPQTVQEAMLKQVTYANTMRTSHSEIDIWQKLPFQLRVELAIVCHKPIISQFPDVFDTTSPPIVYQLLNYFEPTYIIQGAYAFTFETGSGGIYLLSSGVVEVVDEDESGTEIIIGEHREGKIFGMECIEHKELTFVGVRAKEHVSCYRISVASISVMYKEHPSLSRDFFKKIQTVCAGTRQDSSLPLTLIPALQVKEDSFKNKTLFGIERMVQFLKTMVKSFVKEEDVVDTKAVYVRANVDSVEWAPVFKNKLESYLMKNSPSLVLSNQSWKKFVTLKDPNLTSGNENGAQDEAKITAENEELFSSDNIGGDSIPTETEVINESSLRRHNEDAPAPMVTKSATNPSVISALESFDALPEQYNL